MSIRDNVMRAREAINSAAAKAGRGDKITLVAAAKTNGAEAVREAIRAGVDAVGENRVQEMLEKHSQGAYDGVPLHFIGHLQKNKVRSVVGTCGLIESVGSAPLVEEIARRAEKLGIIQDILIEVNIGGEDTKTGAPPDETEKIIESASELGSVRVLGLMAIPPVFTQSGGNYRFFDAMYNLFVDMGAKKYDNVSMQLLSMGMSGSFEDAILAGANMVRLGTAIFGNRAPGR